MVDTTQRDAEGRTLSRSNITTVGVEIGKAIEEAAKDVFCIPSVRKYTERLLSAALKADLQPHRIENTIDVIQEEEDSIEPR